MVYKHTFAASAPNPSLKRSANGRPQARSSGTRYMPARAWRPAVGAGLARTLGSARCLCRNAANRLGPVASNSLACR